MAVLNTLIEQLKTLWSGWSTQQRVGISAATVACVAAVVGTLVWATRADYVVLANQLSPQRAAEIVGVLETEQIAVTLNFSGSAVSVPRSEVSRARLALKDVWEPTESGEESLSSAFPGSPSEEEDRRRQKLEGRIAQSIMQIHGIRMARVHITRPRPSPFVSEQVPTTASVMIDPASASTITPSIAESIITLVARAVEGLAPDQISLTDTSGRQFNAADGIASSMDGQFDYQQRVELRLATKAETMLAMLLGHGKAVVRVSADIDFTETTRTSQKFDADGKVKVQETIESVSQTGGTLPSGDVGTAGNISPASYDPDGDGASYEKELISTDYQNPSTEEIVRDIPGRIERLTIATIVDLSVVGATDPADASAPADPAIAGIDAAQIESIVRQAVGFDEIRGDEIQVMTASLGTTEPVAEAPGLMDMWNEYEPIIQTVGTGLIAMFAFLMGFLLLRRMKPVAVPTTPQDQQLSLDEVRHLAALSDDAKNNPEAAAKVLAAWLGADQNTDTPQDDQAAPAAA